MTATKSQSERMEGELEALRELFSDARTNEDASRMISLSRVIVQQEKEISKQRVHEGVTLDREQVMKMVDEVVATAVEVGKRTLPKEHYENFIDDLIGELSVRWRES